MLQSLDQKVLFFQKQITPIQKYPLFVFYILTVYSFKKNLPTVYPMVIH